MKTNGGGVGPNKEYSSYRDMYEDRIRMTNESIKQLREEKKRTGNITRCIFQTNLMSFQEKTHHF